MGHSDTKAATQQKETQCCSETTWNSQLHIVKRETEAKRKQLRTYPHARGSTELSLPAYATVSLGSNGVSDRHVPDPLGTGDSTAHSYIPLQHKHITTQHPHKHVHDKHKHFCETARPKRE
jgi:hypothetical protein